MAASATMMASTMSLLNPKCAKPLLTPSSKPITTTATKLTAAPKTSLSASVSSSSSTALAGAIFATLSSSNPAFAAQQIADLAEGSDNRGTLLLLVVLPAIGWVLFNILQPALNQINRMRSSKGVVVGLGLGGLVGLAGLNNEAEAAVAEMGSLAAAAAGSDNRGTLLLLVVAPAIGWVLFNILQPALNQINRMRSE